jgi:predicted phage terminase large subunit-like protein
MSDDEANRIKFSNAAGGFKLATSVRGSVMGERGDRILLDDPNDTRLTIHSIAELEAALQWFTEVLPTRINDAGKSATIIIMQRVHERDISGHILSNELQYEHLCLPMEYEPATHCTTSIGFSDWRTEPGELLAPERFSRDYLDNVLKPTLRSWGGTYAESAQLQQTPAPRAGGMFKKSDFQVVDVPPDDVFKTVRGWDLAGSTTSTSPYTSAVKLGLCRSGAVVVLDVLRDRLTPHGVNTEIKTTAGIDGVNCAQDLPQDPGQAGKHQKMALANVLAGHKFHFSPESGSKQVRAVPFAAQCEAGNVYIVRAPWNDAFISEFGSFPAGKFSDQVDAASRAYARLIRKQTFTSAAQATGGSSNGASNIGASNIGASNIGGVVID